jgi:RES domain-containing protein
VYVAESRSLAAFENLVHAEDKELLVSASWSMIPVQFDEAFVLAPPRFPADWQAVPSPDSTRQFGGEWLTKRTSVVLRVPSVVTLGEFCYILNPLHPDFGRIVIGKAEPFSYDGRVP